MAGIDRLVGMVIATRAACRPDGAFRPNRIGHPAPLMLPKTRVTA